LASLTAASGLTVLAATLFLLTACSAFTPSPFPTDDPAIMTELAPEETPIATDTAPDVTPTTAEDSAAATETPGPNDTFLPVVTYPEIVNATAFPNPDLFIWTKVFSGLEKPLWLTGAGDGTERLFIVVQSGTIYVARDGKILDQPFLDISDLASGPHTKLGYTERGLLGLAFHPAFAQNGFFFIHYTDRQGNTVLARYQVSSDNPDRADPASGSILLTQEQPYANHNGGTIAFGPDGMLYMGLGDGGSAGDPLGAGQNPQTLLGKILRLDVDSGAPYAIPADNPYASGGGLPEIWALGLRNPWRFSFDQLTGDLYIADVGQNEWEEVNFLAAGSSGGSNFGWNYREGSQPYQGEPPATLSLADPIVEYPHSVGCSVSGGVVIRDANLPEWQGVYIYGDFCTGRVWGLLPTGSGTWQNRELFKTGFNISSFGEDDLGGIYLLDHSKGNIYQLTRK